VDLLAFFRPQDTGLAVSDTQACSQGAIDELPFQGCDDIVVATHGCGMGSELASILSPVLWLRSRRRRKTEQ